MVLSREKGSIFTLRESLGGRISFIVQNSQYVDTASPWALRIYNFRNFCSIAVHLGLQPFHELLNRENLVVLPKGL